VERRWAGPAEVDRGGLAPVRPELDPGDFNLGNFGKRFARKNPWADFWKSC
jgi:hypothetical protein